MNLKKNMKESEKLKEDTLIKENDSQKRTHICLICKKKDSLKQKKSETDQMWNIPN